MMKPEEVQKGKSGDVESGKVTGGGALYPDMVEDSVLRWAFIRKVYSILAVQFLFNAGVAAAFNFVRLIPTFILSNSYASWAIFIMVLTLLFIAVWPMLHFRNLGLFTVCVSLLIGWTCATIRGKFIPEAAILTTAVVVGLTLYTFWAARRGHDFHFLGPFLGASLLVLLLYLIIQIFFPLGRVALTIYGCLATIVFSGFIIYDTDNLIKRHKYDEYTCAAIALYLGISSLFRSFLAISAIDPWSLVSYIPSYL